MKPITEYIDYRRFLSDYYDWNKEHHDYFSYRYFSQKAGINSASFLKRVIDGKRNLTRNAVEKFGKALNLTEKEFLFFKNLVLFNQAKTATEKQEYYAILRSMSRIVNERVLQTDEHEYFKNWYIPVVRELICTHNFMGNYSELAQAVDPKITAKQAREAVALLIRLGLVNRHDDNRYEFTDKSITAHKDIIIMGAGDYVRSMLDNEKDAISKFKGSECHISSMTIGVSRQSYKILEQEIRAFKDRVKTVVINDKHTERVYEFNLGLFPVSKEYPKSGSGEEI